MCVPASTSILSLSSSQCWSTAELCPQLARSVSLAAEAATRVKLSVCYTLVVCLHPVGFPVDSWPRTVRGRKCRTRGASSVGCWVFFFPSPSFIRHLKFATLASSMCSGAYAARFNRARERVGVRVYGGSRASKVHYCKNVRITVNIATWFQFSTQHL